MIDNFIVFSYLILILIVGLYGKSHLNSFKGYSTVTGSITGNRLILAASIFGSAIGAGTTFGIAEKACAGELYFAIGLALTLPVDLAVAKYIIPRIVERHYGARTVGDILKKYYGEFGRISSGIAAIIISVGFLAVQVKVGGKIFEHILDIDPILGALSCCGVIILYTTVGGFRSILFTNFVQFFAALVAVPIISFIGLREIGLENFAERVAVLPADSDYALWSKEIIFVTLGMASMGMYPNFIQRTLISRDARKTKEAIYIKSAIYFVFLIFVTLNGLLAGLLYPDSAPEDSVLRSLDESLPIGIKGAVVVGLLSIAMSTADSDLNVATITFIKDLVVPLFKIRDEKKLFFIARIVNFIIGICAVIVSLTFQGIIDFVIFIVGFWSPVIVVPLIFALFGITIPKKIVALPSLAGLCSFLLWEYLAAGSTELSLKSVFVGTAVSCLCFLFFVILNRTARK